MVSYITANVLVPRRVIHESFAGVLFWSDFRNTFIDGSFVSCAGGHNKNYAKKEKEKKEKDEKKEKKLGYIYMKFHVFVHVWYYLPIHLPYKFKPNEAFRR